MLAIEIMSLSFNQQILTLCLQPIASTLEYTPICFKPTAMEPALPTSHSGLHPLCSDDSVATVPLPVWTAGLSEAKGPQARALGWTARVGKASWSSGFPLELEL